MSKINVNSFLLIYKHNNTMKPSLLITKVLLLFLFVCFQTNAQKPFVTVWSVHSELKLHLEGQYTYTWEDIEKPEINGQGIGVNSLYMTFPKIGIYRISLTPVGENPLHRIKSGRSLMRIEQWGDVKWSSMKEAFMETYSLVLTATDVPDLSNVTDMSYMFYKSSRYDQKKPKDTFFNSSINRWDVSNVTNMKGMFKESESFNQPLNRWDVSNVTDMSEMFQNTKLFNKSLNSWDVSKVTNMSAMFSEARAFNKSLNRWDVSNVTNMSGMFGYSKYNQPLSHWNVGNVTNMTEMFYGSRAFNQPLDNWDVSNVEDMSEMFKRSSFNNSLVNWKFKRGANLQQMFEESAFNHPSINTWDVSGVVNMEKMFHKAKVFNQSLNNWNPENVTTMEQMFKEATLFNGAIDNWNVGKVISMKEMFFLAKAFNQPLNNWNPENVTTMQSMFLLAESFNQPLNNWDVSSVTDMSKMFEQTSYFNQPLNNWDVSNVTNMNSMFQSTKTFNQPLNDWDVSNVTNMNSMFQSTKTFNQPLDNWDVSSVTNMHYMFAYSKVFNQPLDNWNVSNVIYLNNMFSGTETFNQPLNNWDVSNVTSMSSMFYNTKAFNQPLNNWDVSKVTNMRSMFSSAHAFNQPLNNWNVSKVTDMINMFYGAESFNQPLDMWEVGEETNVTQIFERSSGMSQHHYKKTIDSWVAKQRGTEELTRYKKPFVTVWKIDGTDDSNRINILTSAQIGNTAKEDNRNQPQTFYKTLGGQYSYTWENVNNTSIKGEGWGEGTLSITFPEAGIYRLSLLPEGLNPLHSFYFIKNNRTNSISVDAHISKLLDVEQWGDVSWSTMKDAFRGASFMTMSATDVPDLSSVTDMSGMFAFSYYRQPDIAPFNASINDWDVSNVTNMKEMFRGAAPFNQPLDKWDVSNAAETTYQMFERSGLTLENYKKTMDSWVAKVKGVKELSSNKRPFVTLWKYQRYNLQSGYRAEFDKYLGGSYIYTWEDVNDPSIKGEGWGEGRLRFNFPDEGTYRLSLTPIGLNPLHAFYFNPNKNKYYTHPGTGSRIRLSDYNKDTTDKLMDIEQWGDVQWSTMENAFRDSSLFTISATDTLDLSKVTNMSNMFSSSSFNQPIEHWDVSNVTDMSGMFSRARRFNQSLKQWNVSNVTNMGGMFQNASAFNQSLEQWDVSNVTNMGGMFQNTSAFNQPLERWDVSNVTNMDGMFQNATVFNQPLEQWNVGKVTNMRR